MRTLLVTCVVLASAMAVQAKVWTTVYRCDEVTPLEAVDPNHPTVYRDIMVGTHLVIVVSSDTGGYWWGRLQYSTDDSPYLSLNGRGYDPNHLTNPGSCLPAAGVQADAWALIELGIQGFEFYTDPLPVSGDWFIFDYRAENVGFCSLALYDLNASIDAPASEFFFTHVPSRDFNGDSIVDFEDFAVLASRWSTAADPNADGSQNACDLNSDNLVDLNDLILFDQYWLERTDCEDTATDPNSPAEP